MKKLEDMLNNLKIPALENGEGFARLRVELMQTFLNPQRIYRLRYQWAASIAAFFFVLLLIAFTSPRFVAKVNDLAFGKKTAEHPELIALQPANQKQQLATSSTGITQKSAPEMAQSEKTYLIRQYDSPQRGRIMVVSEYDHNQPRNKIRKVSAGCY